MNDNYADGYVTVEERVRKFFAEYPTGSLRPANPAQPFELVYLDEDRAKDWSAAYGKTKWGRYQPTCFVVYTAAAYRDADDPNPGVGVAWEPFPGLTPYTHNSEIMNAETSAWGRAIVAVGAAEARASADEVRNRRGEEDHAPPDDTQIRDAALASLNAQVDTLTDTAGWAAWKTEHPAWHKRVDTIREASHHVAGLLAAQGADPFLDAGSHGVDAPDGGPASSPGAAPPIPSGASSPTLGEPTELDLLGDGTANGGGEESSPVDTAGEGFPTGEPSGRWTSDELAAFIAAYDNRRPVPDGKAARLKRAAEVAPF